MEKQQSQGQDGAVSSLLPSPQQPAQPVKKRRKVPWASYKPDGFGSFFDTTAEINHKMCVILDLFPNDLDQRKVAFDVAIDPDEHLRCRRSNREVIRRRFDDYTEHLSDYDSFVDDGDESEEGEGAESEDEDYGTIKWSRKRESTAEGPYIHTCMHTDRQTYRHTRAYRQTHTHMHTYTHVETYICVHMYSNSPTHTHLQESLQIPQPLKTSPSSAPTVLGASHGNSTSKGTWCGTATLSHTSVRTARRPLEGNTTSRVT